MSMDEARKQEVLQRIAAWLDAWPDGEPLPEGIDPALVDDAAPPPDLASLTAAVAAMARELQIQSKTWKRFEEGLAPLVTQTSALPARIDEAAARARRDGHDEGYAAALSDLLEAHDRLARGAREARAAGERLSRLARWGGAAAVIGGLAQGFEVTLASLDDALRRHGVRRIDSTGRSFDATAMRAVDTVPAGAEHAPGTVAETLRAGFTQGERLLRPAEVRVAR